MRQMPGKSENRVRREKVMVHSGFTRAKASMGVAL
jgi:hypothetical protein